jgi:hypothetical protein
MPRPWGRRSSSIWPANAAQLERHTGALFVSSALLLATRSGATIAVDAVVSTPDSDSLLEKLFSAYPRRAKGFAGAGFLDTMRRYEK